MDSICAWLCVTRMIVSKATTPVEDEASGVPPVPSCMGRFTSPATGVAVGCGIALASGRLAQGFLCGVKAHDGWTLAGAAVVLFVSGMLAAYVPARRAAGVDPMEALRAE